MDKKCLPKRTTRGNLPPFRRDPPTPQKKNKSAVEQDPEQVQRRQLQARRKYQQFLNFKKYPFHRAVHYFFDLDTFPRSEGHISYAIDKNNALQNSFSNDNAQLKSCTYGQVLNRQLFGLPINEHFLQAQKRQNKQKNVCYSYLFQTQDKKYHYDRSITSLGAILSKMKKGLGIERLKMFLVLTNDKQLNNVFDQTLALQQRMQLISYKIQVLKKRRDNNQSVWLTDDSTYFYHALNQRLHNRISELKQKLTIPNLVQRLTGECNIEQQYNRKAVLTKDLFYYNDTYKAAEIQFLHGSPSPIELLFFHDYKETIKLASFIVAKKSQSLGEVHFYEAKNMVKKLFNYNLTLKTQKVNNFSVFQKNFRKKCSEIKKWQQNNQPNKDLSKLPLLQNTDWRESMGARLPINGKEYLMMMAFYWICRALAQMKPLLSQFPQVVNYISSQYFPKVYNSLVQATQSAHVGMMCVALESLSDLFSKPDPLASLPIKLQIEYSPDWGVALLSKQCLQGYGQQQGNSLAQEQKFQITAKRFKYDSI